MVKDDERLVYNGDIHTGVKKRVDADTHSEQEKKDEQKRRQCQRDEMKKKNIYFYEKENLERGKFLRGN